MNIFVLSHNITKAAEYHNNKHVVKMPTEYTQMLSWSYYDVKGNIVDPNNRLDWDSFPYQSGLYKFTLSKYNHPCTIWTRSSISNWDYLLLLGMAVCREYTDRYLKEHKCQKILEWMMKNPASHLPKIPRTPFCLDMDESCKQDNPVKAYRLYYMLSKNHIAEWGTKYQKVPTRKPKWYLF